MQDTVLLRPSEGWENVQDTVSPACPVACGGLKIAMGTRTTLPLSSLKNAADSMGVAPAMTAGIKADRINRP